MTSSGSAEVAERTPGSNVSQTAALVTVRMFAAALTAVTTLLIARLLPKSAYGRFAVVSGIAGVLVVAADLGLTSSVARFIAEGRVDRRLLGRIVIIRGAVATMAGGILLLYGLVVARGWLGNEADQQQVPALAYLGAALVIANSTVALAFGLLPTMRKLRSLLFVTISYPLVELLALLLAAGLGLTAPRAVLASLAAGVITGIVGLTIVLRHDPTPIAPVQLSAVLRHARPLFVVWVCFAGFGVVDQLAIGLFKGPAAVAPYALSWKLVAMMQVPAAAVATLVAPQLVQQPAHGLRLFERWLAVLTIAYIGIAGICATLSAEILELVGAHYRNNAGVFASLAGYAALAGVAPLASMGTNFLGGARQRVALAVVTVGLNLALDLFLVPTLGAYGAAIATTASFSFYVLGHVRLAYHLLNGKLNRHALIAAVPRTTIAIVVAIVVARTLASIVAGTPWLTVALAAPMAFLSYVATCRLLNRGPMATPAPSTNHLGRAGLGVEEQ